jgi:hypothetical protein
MHEPKKRGGWLRHCGFSAGLLLTLLLTLYAEAYLAISCRGDADSFGDGSIRVEPGYLVAPETLSKLFAPAHAVDRLIRPRYWSTIPLDLPNQGIIFP